MQIAIPELSLVVLIGPSGAGKSTFARSHFKSTEVLSSDFCRGLVSDDENDQSATNDAFDLLHYIARKRLAAGRLTVIDATNVQLEARKPLIALAREFHVLPVAIVFNLPEQLCQERNRTRSDRDFGPHVIRRQLQDLRRSLRGLEREGFRYVFTLETPEQVVAASITRTRLWTDRRDEHGPFDIIGDVHGCYDELAELLAKLGYTTDKVTGWQGDKVTESHKSVTLSPPHLVTLSHPAGRKAVFLGDLVDRGPNVPGVLRLAMGMVASGSALAIPGNHDVKLVKKLRGRDVQITHGLAESLAQLEAEPPAFRQQVAAFLDGLVSHYVLDGGKLVVAHAGMRQDLQGRSSAKVRDFALYGETTGETDEFGLPIRYNWAAEYRGKAMVVYGHTPVPTAEWLNNTINIDTGCVFGGRLTALRYPERELVAVLAYRALETARERLRLERLPPRQAQRLTLIQGSLLYRDARLSGFDAAAVVEVIEHLDPARLAAFERVVFEFARPGTVVLTTPNAEYNVRFPTLTAGKFRHADHRFEWTRAEFQSWAERVATAYGYQVTTAPVGPADPEVGAPSQLAVFTH
jgi:protein phosphatase